MNEKLDNKEWIVDYDQIISIPSTEYDVLLRRKVLQMDDRTRVKFKIKLATVHMRLTEEERQANLINPWDQSTKGAQS